MDYEFLIKIIFRAFCAVVVGALIGSERAKHGRAAGMRTHILVCLGACLTSMISVYANTFLNNTGDITRISAQVISGIGFLGAGMIILRNNNTITGLTTAAGVWTTSVIGIALGFGFYSGAVVVTLLFLISTVVFAKIGEKKRSAEVLYIEIDDMYRANAIIEEIRQKINAEFTVMFCSPKSLHHGNLGINVMMKREAQLKIEELLEIKGIVFIEEEQ